MPTEHHIPQAPRLIQVIGANRWREPWRHALDVCRHFRDVGWSVTAYTRDSKAIDSRFREAGIDLRHSPLRGRFDIYSAITLAQDFRNERPGTIIHVHRYRDAFVVLLARKLARRPDIRVVSTHHAMHRGINHPLARRVYRNLDAQIFVSSAVRDRFLDGWRDRPLPFDINRTHIIIPAVNLHAGKPTPEPEKGPKIILCRAPMEPGNGLETLIDAISRLRGMKTRLWLVGHGDSDYIDTLRRRAITRGVMEMIDWKLRLTDTSALIDECHVGVDPTLTGAPLGPSHIEMMARGRVQVLSSAISPSEYVESGREVLTVPRGDASALGDALVTLIGEADRRCEMGEAAYTTYKAHFEWQHTASELEAIYTSIRR